MTTFVHTRVSNPTETATASRRLSESFASLRGSLREWGYAFQAAGQAPRREAMDYGALLLLGRD
jgi:hypothetical protein